MARCSAARVPLEPDPCAQLIGRNEAWLTPNPPCSLCGEKVEGPKYIPWGPLYRKHRLEQIPALEQLFETGHLRKQDTETGESRWLKPEEVKVARKERPDDFLPLDQRPQPATA